MRISRNLVGIGLLALMTGCSTIQSLNPFASKSKGNVPAPLVELKGSMAVRTAWKLEVGKSPNALFSPALAGNTIIAAGADGDQLAMRMPPPAARCGASRPAPTSPPASAPMAS
jgi:outer membrane protein assembly factor BamB